MELDRLVVARISSEAGVRPSQVEATIALLEQQSTVPFIARYRKEATGNLDEVQIRTISERHEYYKDLLSRRETIFKSIEEQGKLTEEIKNQILACYERNELEDLYLPYKPKRKTRASVAIEKGLEPLAKFIWEQVAGEKPVEELAAGYINAEKGITTKEEALEGALDIVAEWISEDLEIRKILRRMMLEEAVVVSKVAKGREGQKTKYDMYYDFREPVSRIPSHRMLAIRRGVKEQILNFSIESDAEKALGLISARIIKDSNSPLAPLLKAAITDSYERLLNAGIHTEVRAALKARSDSEAISVFEANLSNLLLAAPAGPVVVLGIDPGFRTGCKVAVVNETGKFLEHATTYPTEPKKDIEGSESSLYRLVQKHHVHAIAIGNGTGSRETDTFVRGFLRKYQAGEPFPIGNGGSQDVAPHETDTAAANVTDASPANGSSEGLSPEMAEPTLSEVQPNGVSVESCESFGNDSREAQRGFSIPDEAELQHSGDIPTAATERPGPRQAEMVASVKTVEGFGAAAGQPPIEACLSQERSIQPAGADSNVNRTSSPALPTERHSVFSVMVNESGASVYSASEGARREFSRFDLTVRGAISIARRLQDPLAELVKVHPKSIGVGQYQHDVDQKKLKRGLEATVESCVNRVGVDVNTASYELLRYVSGINQKLAKAIVEYRHQHGRFSSRSQFLTVSGFGEKTFEQAAGFLRIKGGENALDATAVHPESYTVVERMASSLGITIAELIENRDMVESLDLTQFSDGKVGLYTLNDIKQELLKPGRDPRDQFEVPVFRDDVKEVSDLKEGMVLEGAVSNVTNFGAFVDIGVHQDGLVHVSELSNRFVKDPREAVHVGAVVKVKVIGVDLPMKRISLSMKALLPRPKKIRGAKPQPVQSETAKTMAQAAEAAASLKPAQKGAKSQTFNRQPPSAGPRPPKSKSPPTVAVRVKPHREKLPPAQKKPENPPEAVLSFADKIRMLQEKFGGIR
jgi:protein Tex